MLKTIVIIWLVISVITYALNWLTSLVCWQEFKRDYPNATRKHPKSKLKGTVALIKVTIITFLPLIHLIELFVLLFAVDKFKDACFEQICNDYYLD
jgi:hypothetical protein